ncbi:MAG: amino acid adenylation domain-containing protein [Selenomonas sp.]|uniref:non-ribosomal peptide synthetase n=1 Tax=Selenomonas sp. TaxID=2053611 RepID=UPI0025E5A361|nr:non-ribosomal peptide synthetase [Selenomonas sp.]MCR5757434.1 amino acid adenylation domain-containing protein [Selenomonas sp.]
MDKETWCQKNFADEMPDCLPLPDRRESADNPWQKWTLAYEHESSKGEKLASVLYLLGVYGGLTEAGLIVYEKQEFLPLRQSWRQEDSPQKLAAASASMLKEAAAYSWTREAVWDLLGQEKGRGIALALDGDIPLKQQAGLALIFQVTMDKLEIRYASAHYSEAFIQSMGLSWREILLHLAQAETLADMVITPAETMSLLDRFNQTEREYDRQSTIIDQFRAAAQRMPDNIAVIYEEREYTYAQVTELSDKLAFFLHQQGLGRGDTAAVLLDRSEYMVIASLGVLKAGCAYEPLDPNYPDERLSFMTKDAAVKLLIVDDQLADRLANFPDFQGLTLRLSEIPQLPKPNATELAAIEGPQPDDLFMLIYTSGTTGVPKGVRLLHRNLMAFASWHRHHFDSAADKRVTCYNSYGFDGSLADMYPILTVGGAVVVIPEEKKLDLPALAQLIRKHQIYLADFPSQVGRQFALTMDCPSLKYIVVGGEKLVPFEPVYPYIMANEYGPTESTVAITCYDVTKYQPDIPIGTPMDNTAIYVVDSAGRRVPPGALGELWTAGVQVTGGYLNRPEKTQEVFIANPFSQHSDYATAYRTGDIVRYLPDGNIEFVGRRDGLVKIRGFRVELAEVESVIHDFPPVENAAVVACDNPAGGKFIAAYVVSSETIDPKALADFIRERKPPYMVPAAIMQIPDIPRNQNGKLNRRALPEPEIYASATPYVAPKNDVEAELARGFGVALGMDRVSAAEDFFAAGGDSLSMIRLLSECRDLQLNFNLIYEGKTPMGIASLLNQRQKNSSQGKVRDTHFFGPLHQLHYDWGNSLEEGYGLHCDATVSLDPKTDMERLAAAIESTLKAHPAVDARLTATKTGELRWRSGDMAAVKPVVEHISRQDYDNLKKSIRQSMNKPETRMFVTRLFLIEEADGTHSKEFYFDFLHPIIDGDSLNIFLADIDAAYQGKELEPEEYTIFDYYDEIEDTMATEAYKQEQQWNHNYVQSFTQRPSELPGDLDPKGENDTRDIMVPLHIDLKAVDAFTKAQGITDGSLLAASFGLLQARNNGEQAAAALTIYNGRDDIRYERTMGAIYRHYPLCVRWQEDMTAERFVKETQDSILQCRRHALYEGDPVPLIAAFAYQGEDVDGAFDFCGGKAYYEEIEDFEEENFDFFVHRRQDDFYLNLTYNTKEYSDAFVQRFMADYTQVIHALVAGKKVQEIMHLLDH